MPETVSAILRGLSLENHEREKRLPQHLPQHTTAGEGRKPRRGSDRQEENEDDQNIL